MNRIIDNKIFPYNDIVPEVTSLEDDLKDKEYLDFLSVCIEYSMSVEDKLKTIIRYPVIVYRNSRKMRNQKLFS